MRSRVIAGGNLVSTLCDNRAIADDHRAEWTAGIRAHFFECKRSRALHECLFGHHDPRVRPRPSRARRRSAREFRKNAPKVIFLEHNHVVRTLMPRRPEQAPNWAVLPGRAGA